MRISKVVMLAAVPIALYVLFARNEPPQQPIDFPHKRMVQEVGIDCYFCHPYAAVSANAGMPSVDKCLLCHETIRTKATNKLLDYKRRGQGIPWVRVNRLPDYVRFNHERHIAAGQVCKDCHGDIASMETTRSVRKFKMGFCTSCHEKKGVSRDCYVCHH